MKVGCVPATVLVALVHTSTRDHVDEMRNHVARKVWLGRGFTVQTK